MCLGLTVLFCLAFLPSVSPCSWSHFGVALASLVGYPFSNLVLSFFLHLFLWTLLCCGRAAFLASLFLLFWRPLQPSCGPSDLPTGRAALLVSLFLLFWRPLQPSCVLVISIGLLAYQAGCLQVSTLFSLFLLSFFGQLQLHRPVCFS